MATFCHAVAFTGVDYFAPFDVTVGRNHEKRWGVVYDRTCSSHRDFAITIHRLISVLAEVVYFEKGNTQGNSL